MSLSRRKQEDQNLKVLKSIQQLDTNKRCFECDQRGPTYVDVTIGSFVCTSCGGILRGINPPHRVKSISMATFTATEIALIQKRGNEYCAKVFLGKYDDRSKAKPESRGDISKLRMFMEEKYEKKRWYVSPELVEKNREKAAESKPEAAKPASVVATNSKPNVQSTVKPVEPQPNPQKPTVDNILGDFASFDLDASNQPSDTTNSSNFAFADFGSAFSQPAAKATSPFDAFGDFSSGANHIPSSQPISAVPQSTSFQASFPPMTTSAPVASVPPPAPKADKYADLGDLFSMDNSQAQVTTQSSNTLWGSVFMTPVSENQSKGNSAGSVFGMPKSGSVFENQGGGTFNNNSTSTTQPFGNMPQKPVDNFSMPNAQPQQNAGFGMVPSNQQMYASNSQQSGGFAYMTTGKQAGFGSTPPSQPQMLSSIQGGGTGFGVATSSVPPYGVQQQPQLVQNPAAVAVNTQQMLARQQQSASPYMNMTSNQTPAAPASNPFFQPQGGAAGMASNSNPFMAAQPSTWSQQGTTTGAANQVSATNPFMTQTPSMPVQQSSTNPFF